MPLALLTRAVSPDKLEITTLGTRQMGRDPRSARPAGRIPTNRFSPLCGPPAGVGQAACQPLKSRMSSGTIGRNMRRLDEEVFE